MILPNTRTIRYLTANGYMADLCETRRGQLTFDMFGFADVHAINGETVLYVQASTFADRKPRIRRMLSEEVFPKLLRVLNAGCIVELHFWDPKQRKSPPEKPAKRKDGSVSPGAMQRYGIRMAEYLVDMKTPPRSLMHVGYEKGSRNRVDIRDLRNGMLISGRLVR